ncbi:MAG: dimethylamine corrinoid protein 3 [Deltaproteobacteria bacterium]|nr:dimethylamine corrinoid protein 3 [Deltaproteobacteria bacterium]
MLEAMQRAVREGDEDTARSLAAEALAASVPALVAIEQGFVRGIQQAGVLWAEGEYFLPELVTAAQAMKAAMAVLRPALEAEGTGPVRGRVVIGTIHGDIHDIGKTLVATLLAADGFAVHDLGVDVSVARFVEQAATDDADLVCSSALLTTTMVGQRELVEAVRGAGLRARVVVGGAPVTRSWAEQIGADGFADNAVEAVQLARTLVDRAA